MAEEGGREVNGRWGEGGRGVGEEGRGGGGEQGGEGGTGPGWRGRWADEGAEGEWRDVRREHEGV